MQHIGDRITCHTFWSEYLKKRESVEDEVVGGKGIGLSSVYWIIRCGTGKSGGILRIRGQTFGFCKVLRFLRGQFEVFILFERGAAPNLSKQHGVLLFKA
jgi:hypothetical protein